MQHTTSRGSSKRQLLVDKYGKFAVPYLEVASLVQALQAWLVVFVSEAASLQEPGSYCIAVSKPAYDASLCMYCWTYRDWALVSTAACTGQQCSVDACRRAALYTSELGAPHGCYF